MANQLGAVLGGLGAGIQGRGNEFLTRRDNLRIAEEEKRNELSAERRKAFLVDNRLGLNNISAGRPQDALQLFKNRVPLINQLGGNPQDTQEIAGMLASGDIEGATRVMKQLDDRAVLEGILEAPPAPEAPKVVPRSSISPTGQITFVDKKGSLSNLDVPNFKPNEKNKGDAVKYLTTAQIRNGQYFVIGDDGVAVAKPIQGILKDIASGNSSFGTSKIFEDDNGDSFYVTTRKDKNAATNEGAVSTIVTPINGSDPPVGKLQQVDTLGQTPDEIIAQRGKLKQAEILATKAATRNNADAESAMAVAKGLPTLVKSMELLQTIKTSGARQLALNVKQFFGYDEEDETVLSSNLMKSIVKQLRQTFGQQFTAREGDLLQRIEASYAKGNKGNIGLVSQLLQAAEEEIGRGLRAAKRIGGPTGQALVDEIEFARKFRFSNTDDYLTKFQRNEGILAAEKAADEEKKAAETAVPTGATGGKLKFLGFE